MISTIIYFVYLSLLLFLLFNSLRGFRISDKQQVYSDLQEFSEYSTRSQ